MRTYRTEVVGTSQLQLFDAHGYQRERSEHMHMHDERKSTIWIEFCCLLSCLCPYDFWAASVNLAAGAEENHLLKWGLIAKTPFTFQKTLQCWSFCDRSGELKLLTKACESWLSKLSRWSLHVAVAHCHGADDRPCGRAIAALMNPGQPSLQGYQVLPEPNFIAMNFIAASNNRHPCRLMRAGGLMQD